MGATVSVEAEIPTSESDAPDALAARVASPMELAYEASWVWKEAERKLSESAKITADSEGESEDEYATEQERLAAVRLFSSLSRLAALASVQPPIETLALTAAARTEARMASTGCEKSAQDRPATCS